ncbi:kinesin-like protein Klp98A isoform X2 [Thrips palmi]|uniref:Kinesin-like protein Klp98A isoform X2 n=1 Tax=Thrips palmi TaxID=161013 RepID=A0A6P8YF07_THRPL|nr:kinesin-like protein Klp98A isoform X2 [Thrips palmi]
MASVKVAVRVRPFNQRETDMQAKLIIDMKGKKTRIVNSKVADGKDGDLGRERYKDFTFDYSYWSFDHGDPHYASQEQVFRDLGMDVIDCAFEGYNACVFAYGQTGSGKTFTMMGAPECIGLIPRICQTLFRKQQENMAHSGVKYTYRTEVSYLEIYNERVRDLLTPATNHSLRVREHPRLGPYVQDLSRHLVTNYPEIEELMIRGNNVRTTASTNMNDVSSRSHAIFTILFTQACFSGDLPTETLSKVHLVDLAGSERADATGATGKRLQEGAHINKSLVTLGSVISALADVSSPASDGSNGSGRKNSFIPYRDSVLTWLLKDSLGGNSKTIMIAAVSPADCNYGETLSTLRYANRAKNIVNKPTVNEDPNVRLIRELREEIARLRALRDSEMTTSGGTSGSGLVLAQLHQTEARAQALTEEWAEKWRETAQILSEQHALGLRKAGKGVVLDSDRPHLVGIDDDLRSTGVTLYHLKEGQTHIGSEEGGDCDIMLSGLNVEKHHCTIELCNGVATLLPAPQAQCWVNTVPVDKPTKLSQGCIILLGRTNMFRYNDPVEAAKLRKEGSRSHLNLSRLSLLSWSTPDLHASLENLHLNQDSELNESGTSKLRRSSLLLRDKDESKSQRDQFMKQQALEEAQQALDEERERLEQSYLAQSRRLAEDWQRLEQQQQETRASLAQRETELQQLRESLEWERSQQASRVEADNLEVARLQSELEKRGRELSNLKAKLSSWSGEITPTTDSSNPTSPPPLSSPSAIDSESIDSWASTAPGSAVQVGDNDAMKLLIEQHKRHMVMLDAEFQRKVAALAEGRARAERLESDINIVQNAESNSLPIEDLKRLISERTQEELQRIMERKKSFRLDLKERLAPSSSAPAASSSQQSTLGASTSKGLSGQAEAETPMVTATEFLETPYLPALSEIVDDASFHTACASPAMLSASFSSAIQDNASADAGVDTGVLSDSGVELDTRSSLARDPLLHSWLQASTNNIVARALPNCDDSDDVSSTEDCLSNKPPNVRGEGSSSRVRPHHRPPRHLKNGLISLRRGESELNVRDAMRAMQALYQRVANQKMLVIQSLEDDCGKQELNERIAVLQELQKQYLCLELALEQHTGKENRSSLGNLSTLPTLGSIEDSDDIMSEPSYTNGHRESLDHSGLREATLSPLNPATLNSQDDNFSSVSLARSRTSLHSCDDGELIHIPSYVIRGAGSSTHYEYEVRVNAGGERWTLLRRYRRFRELHLQMREKYGSVVSSLEFPPRRLFSKRSEVVAGKRRAQLEVYLRALIRVCSTVASCPLHQARDNLTRPVLIDFSPFFRKGVFESGKYGTS